MKVKSAPKERSFKFREIFKKISFKSKMKIAGDCISTMLEKLAFGYFVTCMIIIFVPTIAVYCTIKDDIRNVLSPLIGGALALFVIPFLLDKYKRKREHNVKVFESNKELYTSLLAIILRVYVERSNDEKIYLTYKKDLELIIAKNNVAIHMQFPSNIYWTLCGILDALENIEEIDVAKYYCKKFLNLIRKHADMTGEACNSQDLIRCSIEMEEQNDPTNKTTN